MTLIYVIIALAEIYSTESTLMNEKTMWTIGFIFFSTIAGLLYLFIGRTRMNREYEILNQTR
ncbi:MAG: PLDc N-terminal domain-containing protein [Sphingobacteriaceae bacterium]